MSDFALYYGIGCVVGLVVVKWAIIAELISGSIDRD